MINELRLNNLMQDAKGRICKVERLSSDPDEVRILAIRGAITSKPVSPIPLTEEILLKCGFFKLDKADYFFIHGYQLNFKISSDLSLVAWHNLAIHNVQILHLHQLQNLFFGLTGKELEVKL